MKKDFEMGSSATFDTPDWQSPKPLNIDIQSSDITGVNFTITLPGIDFDLSVKDDSGKSISNAHVYMYSPS
jgi:hypothetical protein